jgi:1-acyl-sn-glycerol-3-phosphate acyltransferase
MLLIRSLLFIVIAGATAGLSALAILLSFWAPSRVHWAITVGWCRLGVWLGKVICGLETRVEGLENLPDDPSVIMIKHTSTLETYWQVTVFPKTTWVIKHEVKYVPILGWAMKLMLDPIFINRSAGRSAVKQVIEQGKKKLAEGTWITVFPEGTRMPPGETRRYGVSGAALAQKAGCKIVPVAHNAGDYWGRRSVIKRPGKIRMCIGPPIDASGRNPKETNLLVQEWIEGKMREISVLYQDNDKA